MGWQKRISCICYYGGPQQHAFEGSEDASQLIVTYYRSFFLTLDSEPQIWSPGHIPELTTENTRKQNQEEEKLSIHALG